MAKLTASQDISQFLASANKTEAVGVLEAIKTENLLASTLIVQSNDTVKAYLGNIAASAFVNQTTLKGLSLGSSVTTIGSNAFYQCAGFTGSLTIPNSVTTIGEYAFTLCNFTGSLTIPNSVTTIGYRSFNVCSGFNGSLTIGNSVTSIASYAFYECFNFTGSLVIPNSVTTIGEYAFGVCGFTESLTIGNSVTTIGNSAFRSCVGFTRININRATAPAISLNAFSDMTGVSPAVIHVPINATGYAASYDGLTVVYDL